MLHSQACDGVDFWDQDMCAQWRKLQVINFSKKCCPNATSRHNQCGAIVLRQKWSRGQAEARFDAMSDWHGSLRRRTRRICREIRCGSRLEAGLGLAPCRKFRVRHDLRDIGEPVQQRTDSQIFRSAVIFVGNEVQSDAGVCACYKPRAKQPVVSRL
jgi:hypothetical protein